jgi:hypothetical protein
MTDVVMFLIAILAHGSYIAVAAMTQTRSLRVAVGGDRLNPTIDRNIRFLKKNGRGGSRSKQI